MTNTYRHDHKSRKLKLSLLLLVLSAGSIGLLLAGLFVYNDIRQNQASPVQGEERTVAQVLSNSESYLVNEPGFDFELPGDWREIDRIDRPSEQSITWQATLRNEDNRYLKLYMNTIPDDPIVRLLPVSVRDSSLFRGQLSGNCSSFSGTGSLDRAERRGRAPVLAKWEDVEFMCDLGRVVDENVIGTGQAGEPLNTFTITGENSGTNRYFFVYTDRNVRPNFDILYNAVNTFFAK